MAGLRWRVCRSRWRVCRRARAGGHFGGFAVITRLQALPRLPRFRLRRSGSSRAHAPPGESHPHSAKLSTLYTTKLTPSPRTPHPCFTATTSLYLSLGGKPDGATPPGSPPVNLQRRPRSSLARPGPAGNAPAPLPPSGYSSRSSGTVDGAARRAPDARRHGEAGRLRLRDTAPEVGEGQQARGGSERGPWRRARFPRVCAWAVRCLYPDFRRPGAYLCRHVLPHLPMRIAGGARAWWSRGRGGSRGRP